MLTKSRILTLDEEELRDIAFTYALTVPATCPLYDLRHHVIAGLVLSFRLDRE